MANKAILVYNIFSMVSEPKQLERSQLNDQDEVAAAHVGRTVLKAEFVSERRMTRREVIASIGKYATEENFKIAAMGAMGGKIIGDIFFKRNHPASNKTSPEETNATPTPQKP
jgi:predicted aconitase